MAKGLGPEDVTFILDEHELRKHEDRKAQVAPPGKRIEVVHTGNLEKKQGEITQKAQEAERKTQREVLLGKYERLKRQVGRLEKLFKKKGKK